MGHTAAVFLADGGLRCWGWNHSNIYAGETEPNPTPAAEYGIDGQPERAAPGGEYTCVLATGAVKGGRVQCWGFNIYGQLGVNPGWAPVDVLAPCALGASLNAATIPTLQAKLVCGAANNQLALPSDGNLLADRGIAYLPDYLVNAGGIISVAREYRGEGEENAVMAEVGRIRERVAELLEVADKARERGARVVAITASQSPLARKADLALIVDHPEDYGVYSQTHFSFNNIRQMNRNELLGEPGVDGIKTGHTEEAGFCLVSSAKRGDMRLVAVVLGTASRAARTEESRKLLTYGFSFYETTTVLQPGAKIAVAQVWGGAAKSVELGVTRGVHITVPRGRVPDIKALAVDVHTAVEAPVAAGQELGRVSVSLDGQEIDSQPLVALQPVEAGGFFRRFWDSLALFFMQLFGKA